MWKWVSKDCSTNEYINEFVVILKSISFKMGNWKLKFWEISKFNGYKKKLSHSRNNLFISNTPKK